MTLFDWGALKYSEYFENSSRSFRSSSLLKFFERLRAFEDDIVVARLHVRITIVEVTEELIASIIITEFGIGPVRMYEFGGRWSWHYGVVVMVLVLA